MNNKHVLIVGGGIAGISAALPLSRFGMEITIIESAPFAGGHAVQFACKATDSCVKCGACQAEERLYTATRNEAINIRTASRISDVSANGRLSVETRTDAQFIDPAKCTGCGECLAACKVPGAVVRGYSPYNHPPFVIDGKVCKGAAGENCDTCVAVCPEAAVSLDSSGSEETLEVDAVIVATGFKAFHPVEKPYKYKKFDDVLTNLDLERMIKQQNAVVRPSDGKTPSEVGFIQCVGSRDDKLGHLWCSQVCCGSALRMANWIRASQPDTRISVFYIDIQTFGRQFESFYAEARRNFEFIRTIPGDVYLSEDYRLQVNYFDPEQGKPEVKELDLLVLSVGLTPQRDNRELGDIFGISPGDSGFFAENSGQDGSHTGGIFFAGAATGPMSIADTIAGAESCAWDVLQYLKCC